MTAFVAIGAAGLATLAVRVMPVAVLSRRPTPAWLKRVLTQAGPAALAALAAPAVLRAPGASPAGLAARVVAVGVAMVVARRTGSMALTVAAGLPILWIVALLEAA